MHVEVQGPSVRPGHPSFVPAGTMRVQFVGFAGLARTTVERLLRENGAADENERATQGRQPSGMPGDMRHVLGGECTGVQGAQERALCLQHVREMQKMVAAAGGRTSSLYERLVEAGTYIRLGSAAGDAEWEAFRCVVAGDLTPQQISRDSSALINEIQ